MSRRRSPPRGQATVELVALLPVLAMLALVAAQVIATAHAWSLAGGAARAGARAAEVGAPPGRAARAGLPPAHAARARIDLLDGGRRVRVRLRTPRVMPLLPTMTVAADAEVAGGPR